MNIVFVDSGLPYVSSETKRLPIPGKETGIRFDMVAGYLVVNLDSLGVVLKWDTKVCTSYMH